MTDQYDTSFGIQPRCPEHTSVSRRISLKNDLHWAEVANLQQVMKAADFWDSFPEPNLRLITAEVKAGSEQQRIDLLYLRDDGAIFPCELKVGGDDPDSHGQLIRYLADLANQPVSREWVIAQRKKYLERRHKEHPQAKQLVIVDLQKFRESIESIANDQFRLLSNTGILIDEGFPETLTNAVRFLNTQFGFDIRMLRLDAFVADDWNFADEEYAMRLEFTDVEDISAEIQT